MDISTFQHIANNFRVTVPNIVVTDRQFQFATVTPTPKYPIFKQDQNSQQRIPGVDLNDFQEIINDLIVTHGKPQIHIDYEEPMKQTIPIQNTKNVIKLHRIQQSRYEQILKILEQSERNPSIYVLLDELLKQCLVDSECITILGRRLSFKNRQFLIKQLSNYRNLQQLENKHTKEGIPIVQVLHTILEYIQTVR